MYASMSIIVNKILKFYLLDTRTLPGFRALIEFRGTHMHGWSIRHFIIKSRRYTRADVVIIWKWKACIPGVCEHRGFITKDPICFSSERDSV